MSALRRVVRLLGAIVVPAISVPLLAQALALPLPLAPATDRQVGAGCTYATIAAAVAAAAPGDRLLIEGGRIFTENVVITKSLTLQGGYSGCATGLSKPSTIHGGGIAPPIYLNGDASLSLANLRLMRGFALKAYL